MMQNEQQKLFRLIDLVLACPSMSNASSRLSVIDWLPDNIKNSVDYAATSNHRQDVTRIIKTCLNFENGLQELLEAIKFYDVGTNKFNALKAYVEKEQIGQAQSIKHNPATTEPPAVEPYPKKPAPSEVRRQQLDNNIKAAYQQIDALEEKRLIFADQPVQVMQLNYQIRQIQEQIAAWEAELSQPLIQSSLPVVPVIAPSPQVANPPMSADQFLKALESMDKAEERKEWESVIEIGESILRNRPKPGQALPKTANAYKESGLLNHNEGEFEAAIADFSEAIRLEPKKGECYYLRSKSYISLNKQEEYRTDLEQAADLGHPQAMAELDKIKAEEAQARFEAELNSDDPAIRKKAAEQRLANRLQNLHGLDPEFITCAEYQLFIDEKRNEDKYYQPQHWTDFTFPKGQATSPLLGVDYFDAYAFVEWLNEQPGAKGRYRLPYPNEIQPGSLGGLYLACSCQEKNGVLRLRGLSTQAEQDLRRQISGLAKTQLPPPSNFILAFDPTTALALASSTARTRAHELLPHLILNPLNRAKQRSFARARAIVRDHDPVRDFGETGQKIVAALERQAVDEALRLARPLKNSNDIYQLRRASLLVDLLEAAKASSGVEQRRAYRRYTAHLAEYDYIGYAELKVKGSNSLVKQIIVDLFWWAQMVMAREEKGFPAWEGIRIVAE